MQDPDEGEVFLQQQHYSPPRPPPAWLLWGTQWVLTGERGVCRGNPVHSAVRGIMKTPTGEWQVWVISPTRDLESGDIQAGLSRHCREQHKQRPRSV